MSLRRMNPMLAIRVESLTCKGDEQLCHFERQLRER